GRARSVLDLPRVRARARRDERRRDRALARELGKLAVACAIARARALSLLRRLEDRCRAHARTDRRLQRARATGMRARERRVPESRPAPRSRVDRSLAR